MTQASLGICGPRTAAGKARASTAAGMKLLSRYVHKCDIPLLRHTMRSGKQHVPIDQYLDNLRSIVQHVRRVGANATVIITPPPVYEPDRLIDRQRKHGVSDRTALAERTNQMTGARRVNGKHGNASVVTGICRLG